MGTDTKFLQFVVDQLARGGHITYRKMFGEYAIYCEAKVVALVCDNHLYMKPTEAGRALLGTPLEAPPYPNAKNWFLIGDELDDAEWLGRLVRATADELPVPKPKKAVAKKGVAKKVAVKKAAAKKTTTGKTAAKKTRAKAA
jgi:TfoX/Sxy family transcriptional regulator of competence genes